jgi:hypothetical protein
VDVFSLLEKKVRENSAPRKLHSTEQNTPRFFCSSRSGVIVLLEVSIVETTSEECLD